MSVQKTNQFNMEDQWTIFQSPVENFFVMEQIEQYLKLTFKIFNLGNYQDQL